MKTKILVLIGAVVLVTLSFTFPRLTAKEVKSSAEVRSSAAEPVGGFAALEITR